MKHFTLRKSRFIKLLLSSYLMKREKLITEGKIYCSHAEL